MSSPAVGPDDFWTPLRATTPARIGIARSGNGASTRSILEAGAAHALARDAVHDPLDVEALIERLGDLTRDGHPLGDPVVVTSAAPDRATYLTRPDLGRRPADPDTLPTLPPGDEDVDVAFVLADGLSARAVQDHAVGLLGEMLGLLPAAITVAPPVIATQSRVALGDHIGEALGARMVLVLIGERPGLSASDSLGAYLTWAPAPGIADSSRNCVSNIRPPHGLSYAVAARTLAALMEGARRIEATGVGLKDVGGELAG